jgi:hypothetical protein
VAPLKSRNWPQAAIGTLLVALGGAIFRSRRRARTKIGKTATAKAAAKSARKDQPRPSGAPGTPPEVPAGQTNVRTEPRIADPPPRTQYWPPPAPEPVEGTEAGAAAEKDDKEDQLRVDAESEKLGYEVQDTRAGKVAKVVAFSVTLIIACIGGLFWFVGSSHRRDSLSPPLTQQQLAVIVPPGPRLQDHPLHDIATEKKRQSELLEHYAWSEPTHRTARIPIARAEALMIGRPLDPVEPAPLPSDPTPPVAPPAAPTSAGAGKPAPQP